MDKLALILNFFGALLIWIDSWLLTKVISTTELRLGDPTGCRTILSWVCSRFGISMLVTGFLLQWISYTPKEVNEHPRAASQEQSPKADKPQPVTEPARAPSPAQNPPALPK
jgi:hypothetical protein